MKIYTRKEEFFKRYNLKGREVAVKADGYRVDCRTGADGAVLHVYIEKQFGWWYATEFVTGLRISNSGCKTRKAMAEYVESEKERIYKKVQEILERHASVYDLGPAMTYDEYSAALHAEDAEEVTDNGPAAPQEEPNEVQEVEPEYNRFMEAFQACETLEDLKNVYANEYVEAHYNVDELTNLRRAWYNKFDDVQCVHRSMAGKIYSTESAANHETCDWFPEFVSSISNMSDVEFDIEGTWLWVSGDTKPHREELKRLGLRWAPKKKMWYKKPAEKCPAAV